MRGVRSAALVALAVLTMGCASTGGTDGQPSNSITSRPSQRQAVAATSEGTVQRVGHPQVVIAGTTRKAVSDALVERLAPQGWSVTKSNDYLLELEQPAKGAAGFFGSLLSVNKYVTDPVYRLNFNIFESGDDVRATASYALIQNPHTGSESPVRMDWKKHEAGLWDLLEAVRNQLGRVKFPGDSLGTAR